MKVYFYYASLSFCLPLYLRKKRNGELFFNTKKVTKQELELECKNRFTITDDGVQEAVILHYHVNNYFR